MRNKFATHLKLQIVTIILMLSLGTILPITADAQTNSSPTATNPTWPPVDPVKVFGSQENLKTIQHPSSVVAYRVEPRSILSSLADIKIRKDAGLQLTPEEEKKLNTPVDPKTEIAGYRILSAPVELSTNTIQQLATIWSTNTSYADVRTSCMFSPGIALKYTRDKKQFTLLICFHCAEVQTVVNDHSAGGAKLFPVENQIITLAKQIFPNDTEIQKLGK